MLRKCRFFAAALGGAALAATPGARAQEVTPFATQVVNTAQKADRLQTANTPQAPAAHAAPQPLSAPEAPVTTGSVKPSQTLTPQKAIEAVEAVKAVEAARSGKSHREVGMASFYRVSGPTASGMKAGNMTAAHRRLPFGSRVRVKDVSSGKEVVVVITDRGPFKKSRVIDLSHAAAVALGITGRGVAKVEVSSE